MGLELDSGLSLKESIKNVIEKKLLGTWKLAFMSLSNPDNIFFTKNAGEIIFGKNDDYLVVSTEDELFSHENGKLTEKKSL